MERRKTDRNGRGHGSAPFLDVEIIAGILWRRRFLMMIITALIIIPAVIYVAAKPTVYKSTISMLFESPQMVLGDFQAASIKTDDPTISAQQGILLSPQLVRRTVDELRLGQKNPENMVRIFLSRLVVEKKPKTNIITLSYEDEDPIVSAQYVNKHAQSYIHYTQEARQQQAQEANIWIAQQVSTLKEDIRKKSEAVQKYRSEAGIISGRDSGDLVYQQISDISKQLVPIEALKASLMARSAASSEDMSLSSPIVQSLKAQISLAQQDLTAVSATLGRSHPDVISARKRLERANSDLHRETNQIFKAEKAELGTVLEQETILRKRLAELNEQAGITKSKESFLQSLEAEEQASRTLLENFLKKNEEIKSQIDLKQSNVRILSSSDIPASPSGIRKSALIIAIIFFGIAISAAITIGLEYIDRGVETADDARSILKFRFIGALPNTHKIGIDAVENYKSLYMEEIKKIYLSLSKRNAAKSIMISSAQEGEGKTSSTLSLARYLNRMGQKILIVDADTTSPSLAEKVELTEHNGLAGYLSGQDDLDSLIQKHEEGFYVLQAVNQNINPVDVMNGRGLQSLIDELKPRFDHILIDTAPVLKTTDAEIIASFVDQVVLIVEKKREKKYILKQVSETLRQRSKDIPSFVLNKCA